MSLARRSLMTTHFQWLCKGTPTKELNGGNQCRLLLRGRLFDDKNFKCEMIKNKALALLRGEGNFLCQVWGQEQPRQTKKTLVAESGYFRRLKGFRTRAQVAHHNLFNAAL